MVNRVILVGRIGQDVELRYTQNGLAVANFSLATNESFKQGGERVERTEWHRIVAWGKQAEFCSNYLGKGRQVFVEGRIQTREWEDKDGERRRTTEIVAQSIQALGSRPTGEQGSDEAVPGGGPDEDSRSEGERIRDEARASMGKGVKQEQAPEDDIPF